MIHRAGPFDQETLIKALAGYLPLNGKHERDEFEVPYIDDDANKVFIANFIWLNNQWIFIDVRET